MTSRYEATPALGVQSQQYLCQKAHHRSGTFREFPLADTALTIPARFAKQVASGSARLAVKTSTDQVTFQELNDIANNIAWSVRDNSKHSVVALVLEQGVRAIAAILGSLKAGRPYLHLDPGALSPHIIERVLERFEKSTIISDQKTITAVKFAGPWIDIEDVDKSRVEEPKLDTSSDEVAQFLLTSGSTGIPKIIYHTHRTILTSIRNSANSFHICPEDRVTLFASGTGQASGVMFSSLLSGASVHHLNVRKESFLEIAQRMLLEAVTIYFSSVTLFRHFLRAVPEDQIFPDLRLVRLGSEPAYRKDFELWKNHFSDHCVLMNGLATSEAGVALAHYMDKSTTMDSVFLPVGRPVDGVSVTIQDDDGNSLGVNETGEIVIESDSVALGYWGLPDLTAAVFAEGRMDSKRVYRTNDLGRVREDGSIEHLGRKDFRIKIRGYWVDLGEVERTLMDFPDIQAAVVVAHDEIETEHERLVAYVVPSCESKLVVSELRRYLESILAQHMVPAVYVVLESLPTNAAGKIDRAALPVPDRSVVSQEACSRKPRTDTEGTVGRIWAEVLGLNCLGIEARFLDLGGDSLLAAQIVARVHAAYGVEIPAHVLLQSTTIEEMAFEIDKHRLVLSAKGDVGKLVSTIEDMREEDVERVLSDMLASDKSLHGD